MQKSKPAATRDEDEKGAASKIQFDLEDDDDEIIDLEEIIELEDEALDDEDHLGLDAEILDADEDFDFDDLDEPAKEPRFEGELEDDLEDDFLKNLSFTEGEPTEEQFDVAGMKALEEVLEVKRVEPMEDASSFVAEASSKLDVAPVVVPLVAVEPEVVQTAPAGQATLEATPSMDEIVSAMEGRLMDAIRAIVETKLPEIVRDILREEIEKAKGPH